MTSGAVNVQRPGEEGQNVDGENVRNVRTESKLQSLGSRAATLSKSARSSSIAFLVKLVISSAEWFHSSGFWGGTRAMSSGDEANAFENREALAETEKRKVLRETVEREGEDGRCLKRGLIYPT
jgi:hypothetical protein